MTTPAPPALTDSAVAPKRQLTLFDSTSIIVGIIIGAGIYEATPTIAAAAGSSAMLLGVWLLGAFLSLVGALCYAELGTAYPREGGDYVYLTRAFGRPLGFLFAWAQLWVVRPGSIGAMAYIFARYANQLVPLGGNWVTANAELPPLTEAQALLVYALASILILSFINILGVREGKWTQNILTTTKVIGLLIVFAIGLWVVVPNGQPAPVALAAEDSSQTNFKLAMIFVLFAYGGWNEMAYVAAEVRNPQRNILNALILGTVAVGVVYLLVTLAFLHALGYQGVAESQAVAAEVLKPALGDWGARFISALICISALGAVNGQIFTGARIYYAMGKDHRLYAKLGQWSARFGTPVWSLVIQALITAVLVVGFGLTENGFESMVKFTTPVFWFFLLLVGVGLFVLRYREPDVARPYRVPGYPITPILFCLSSLFMVYSSLAYAVTNQSWEALWAVGLLLLGLFFCFYDPRPEPEEEKK
jgi:APA family basic amino acid/polyamine antiporter